MKRSRKPMAMTAILLGMLLMSISVNGAGNAAGKAAKIQNQVALQEEMAPQEDILDDWMTPVYAEALRDGSYDMKAKSSSPMFHIEQCELTVKDGTMSAVITMGGTGYLKVYMGTGEEAMLASEEDMIPFTETEDGKHTYQVPVQALDMAIPCTAFSKNREKWYDRMLVFDSSSLPLNAFKELPVTTTEMLGLKDGTYTCEVFLESSSGKAKVESPAVLYIEDGLITAEIVFGSDNYDYVIVENEKCFLVNSEGNSTFQIPVIGFDYNIPLIADSIALGAPRELEYSIRFESLGIKEVNE